MSAEPAVHRRTQEQRKQELVSEPVDDLPAEQARRAFVTRMAAEGFAAPLITTFGPPEPVTEPQARLAASPGTEPKSRPVGTPQARPAAKPGTGPARKPEGRPRQLAAIRVAAAATAALVLFAVIAGTTEVALHGFRFFVFRSVGTGETGPNGLQEDQGPGQPDAPKPTPSHIEVQPSPRSTVTVHHG